MNDLSGVSLGRYHLLEKLGEGGMAIVYKAFDTRLQREVAVKLIRKGAFPADYAGHVLKRFERESQALARLSHPNIIQLYDYGEYEGLPYLVMEYVKGGTLKRKLGTPIPWREAFGLLLPIVKALGYAHSENLVHRDVKPSNILLAQDGRPMLADFGIAKILDRNETTELTGSSMAMGTPEYMAPEQTSAKNVDSRADLYSLGVVLYEMIAGRKPYQADTPMAVLIMHVRDPLPSPKKYAPDLPDEVEHVLDTALAKKPEDRYQSMGEMAKAMEELLTGKPVKEAQPARRVKEETQTAVDFVPGKKTQVGEKPIVREKSMRRGVWGVIAAGIGVLLLVVALTSKPGAFNLFPTAMATASLTPLPTLTITPSGTPEPTLTPTEAITPSPIPTPTDMVASFTIPNSRISKTNISSLNLLTSWTLPHYAISISISPNGQNFAVVENGIYYPNNGLVTIRDIDTGSKAYSWLFPGGEFAGSVKFLPNGNLAILMMNSGYLIISDTNGNQIHDFYLEPYGDLRKALDISPDGQLIAAGGCCSIGVWNSESGHRLILVAGDYSNSNPILSLAFSKDGNSIFAGSGDGFIRMWDARTGNLLRVLSGHNGGVVSLDVSPNGNYLVSTGLFYNPSTGAGDKTVRLWRISDGKQLCMFDDTRSGFYDASFSPDGSFLAAGGSGWEGLLLLNSSDCSLLHTLTIFDHSSIQDLEFSADGRLLITAGDGKIDFIGVSP